MYKSQSLSLDLKNMKPKTFIVFVGGATLLVTAVLLSKPLFRSEPQQVTYTTGNPIAQAELERLLKKHDVQFTYASGTLETSNNSLTTVTAHGSVVIKDAGAPNAVIALNEFFKWSASHGELPSNPASLE